MNLYADIAFLHGGCPGKQSGRITLKHRDYYCLQYNHAGTITVQVGDGLPIEVQGPSLLFTYPGTTFRFGSGDGRQWHHNYVSFRGTRVDAYLQSGLLSRAHPVARVVNGERFLRTFETCVEAVRMGAPRHPRATHALEGLLVQLDEERAGLRHGSKLEERIRQLRDKVGEHPERPWDFRAEAARLHISYDHFRRLFRRVVGDPPGQYLLHARLASAAEQLVGGDEPIKQIAATIGMPDIHHFTKLFVRRYQLPPARFRRELRGHPGR